MKMFYWIGKIQKQEIRQENSNVWRPCEHHSCVGAHAWTSMPRQVHWSDRSSDFYDSLRLDVMRYAVIICNSATTKSVIEEKRFFFFFCIEFELIWYQRHIVFSKSEHSWVKPICHRTDHSLWDINTVITHFRLNVYLLCFDFKCMMVNRWSQCTYFAIS